MTDINTVSLVGRNVFEPNEKTLTYTNNGTAKLSLTIAVNRAFKNSEGNYEDKTSFFDLEYFGKAAESVKPYINKGTQLAVNGYLEQDRWEKDGEKHNKIKIIVNTLQLVGGGNKSDKSANFTPVESAPAQKTNNFVDETIPF